MKTFNEAMIKDYKEFGNKGSFEIEGYVVKFDNNTKELVSDYPNVKELRVWFFDLDEKEEAEKVSISDINGLKFEVVNEFPKGYIVWDINTTSNYLPLCEVNKDKSVNVETLKCIELESNEDVQTVLTAVRNFKTLSRRTLDSMKKYYKEYHNVFRSMATVRKCHNVGNALEALSKVGIE
jgi:hypothetical protein